LQQVSTIAICKYVITWMIEDEALHELEAFVHTQLELFYNTFNDKKIPIS